jgi:putative transcriptional regulator
MIDFSILEMMLMQYAAGGLTTTEALMVASHAALNPKARKKIAAYEALGGQMLCENEVRAPAPDCLDKIMAKIDGACGDTPCADTTMTFLSAETGLREDIRVLINTHCQTRQNNWTVLAPGIDVIYLTVCTSSPHRLRLVRLAAGQQAPLHRHAGVEMTLVLDGGFSDDTGHYGVGDMIVIDDPAFTHAPKADETGCTCLTLMEAPLRFNSRLMQILNIFKRF